MMMMNQLVRLNWKILQIQKGTMNEFICHQRKLEVIF